VERIPEQVRVDVFRDFQIAERAINAEKKNYVVIIQWLRRKWSALERRCTGYIIGE